MAVHRRMLNEGYMPNATTYNALISAYGKAGQLDKVMEVCMPIHVDQSDGFEI
jgi:pentatricopeptide repeat domain-containing protein 1